MTNNTSKSLDILNYTNSLHECESESVDVFFVSVCVCTRVCLCRADRIGSFLPQGCAWALLFFTDIFQFSLIIFHVPIHRHIPGQHPHFQISFFQRSWVVCSIVSLWRVEFALSCIIIFSWKRLNSCELEEKLLRSWLTAVAPHCCSTNDIQKICSCRQLYFLG